MSHFRQVRERLASAASHWPGAVRAFEIVAFALLLPLLGHLVFPADPLGLAHGFPWVVVGPVALAARYGVAQGVCCALLAGASFALLGGSAALSLAIGTLVLATLVGDAASGWRRRSLRAEAENGYLTHRLKEFSNDYHVLSLSHGQLEAALAGQRYSLRQALQRLQPALATRDASREAGEELMAVFAQFCSVQVAGLYTMKSASLIDETPLAVLGDMPALPVFDPLLRLAIAERQLVSMKLQAQAESQPPSGLLAAVPIVDARDRLHAVLAISDMHFMAFQQDNLDKLALLSGYIGDRIAHSGSLDASPAEHFLAELDTALRFARSHGVQGSLVVLRLAPHRRRDAVMELLTGDLRSLDCAWRVPASAAGASNGDAAVAVLLPLVGKAGGNAWLDRQAEVVQQRFGVSLRELIGSARCLVLDGRSDRRSCLQFIAGHAGDELDAVRVDHVA